MVFRPVIHRAWAGGHRKGSAGWRTRLGALTMAQLIPNAQQPVGLGPLFLGARAYWHP